MNRVQLIGRIGKEPELEYVVVSKERTIKVATFQVCTTERERRGHEVFEYVDWHFVKATGKWADIVERHLHKGYSIYLEGTLRTTRFVSKDNITRNAVEIFVTDIDLYKGSLVDKA